MKFSFTLSFIISATSVAQSDLSIFKASFEKYLPQARVEFAQARKLQPFPFESLSNFAEDLSQDECNSIKKNMQSENNFYDNVTGETIISDFCTLPPVKAGMSPYKRITLHHVSGQTNMGLSYKMIIQSSIPSYVPGKRSAFLVFLDANKQVLEIQDQDFAIDSTKKIDFHLLRIVSKDNRGNVYERSYYYIGSWGLNPFEKLEKYDFYGYASADQKNPVYFKLRTYTPQAISAKPTFEEVSVHESPDPTWDHVLPAIDSLSVGHIFQYGQNNQRTASLTRRISILTQSDGKTCAYGSVSGNNIPFQQIPSQVQEYAECDRLSSYGHKQQN